MAPTQSHQLNEGAVTGQKIYEVIIGGEVLTVESDQERISRVNQLIREGRCKISRLDNSHTSAHSLDMESESDSPSSSPAAQ